MTMTTTKPTEANLEARINATLQQVFRGISDLRHQLRFKVKVGRTKFDLEKKDYVEGRADIIIYQGDKPLAVLELKREGLELTADDDAQGRSYAFLVQAPILIVSNGTDTRVFQTHDMSPLAAASLDGAEVTRRIQSAAKAAQSSVNSAISKLLGTDLAQQAIRAITASELEELTGGWESNQRFVKDFLVPRKATASARQALASSGKRAVIVYGPPLCGKSSVLRELSGPSDTEPVDVLFLDGSACSEGLFRRLANILAVELSWPATTDDARQWLRQLSNRTDRKMLVCIDSPQLSNSVFKSEMDELISKATGNHLQVVLAVDENDVEKLTLSENMREETKLSRQSDRVQVKGYDDDEYDLASALLASLGGGLVHGAKYALELRSPWVLRAMAATRMTGIPKGLTAVLPPQLGREMFDIADDRFSLQEDIRIYLSRLASLYLTSRDRDRKSADVLASLYLFSIDDDLAKENFEREDIRRMMRFGLVRRGKSATGKPVLIIRMPELFGCELALALAEKLKRRFAKDADKAITWFVRMCSRTPLGDAIGAQAIYKAVKDLGAENALYLINRLLERPPSREKLAPGSRMMMLHPSAGPVNFTVEPSGALVLQARRADAPQIRIEVDEDDLMAVANIEPWLILSQLREFRLAFFDRNEDLTYNLASMMLLELGSSPIVLRKPGKDLEGYHLHEFPGGEISCLKNGIAEPVTWAITELLGAEHISGVDRDDWVQQAAASGSLPLINRLGQSLTHLSHLQSTREWATRMIDEVYEPARAALPFFH